MGWIETLLIVAGLGLAALLVTQTVRERRVRRRLAAMLSAREPLSAGEFATRFFGPEPKRVETAEALRDLLEEHISLSLAGLRPEDRLPDILNANLASDPTLFFAIEDRLHVDT